MKKNAYIEPRTEVLDMDMEQNFLTQSDVPTDGDPTNATEPDEVKGLNATAHSLWEEW